MERTRAALQDLFLDRDPLTRDRSPSREPCRFWSRPSSPLPGRRLRRGCSLPSPAGAVTRAAGYPCRPSPGHSARSSWLSAARSPRWSCSRLAACPETKGSASPSPRAWRSRPACPRGRPGEVSSSLRATRRLRRPGRGTGVSPPGGLSAPRAAAAGVVAGTRARIPAAHEDEEFGS